MQTCSSEFDAACKEASEVLVFDPGFMDPKQDGCLYLCGTPEDVLAMQINAVCLSAGAGADDLLRCRKLLNAYSNIVITCPDSEKRMKISEGVRRCVGGIPVWIATDEAFHGCRTLRELRDSDGIKAIDEISMHVEEVPVYGLLDLSCVDDEARRTIIVRSGFRRMDSLIGGIGAGELSVITGKRGSGKSTIMGQILLNAIDSGCKVFAYSGELPSSQFKRWIMQQAAGPSCVTEETDPCTGYVDYLVNPLSRRSINEWMRGKFYLCDNNATGNDEKRIFSVMNAAHLHGCRIFLIDNCMTVRFHAREDDRFQAQSDFVGSLKEFSRSHGAHVILVAHPRKTNGAKHLTDDDVSGTGDVVNWADNAYAMEKLDADDAGKAGYDGTISVLKNRESGRLGTVALKFREDCRRFSTIDGAQFSQRYGWDPEPVQGKIRDVTGEDADLPF